QGAFDCRDDVPGRDAVAVSLLTSPPELRVDLSKRCLSEREAGENAFGLRGDYRSTGLVTRDEDLGSYVVCHAIFAERSGDEISHETRIKRCRRGRIAPSRGAALEGGLVL